MQLAAESSSRMWTCYLESAYSNSVADPVTRDDWNPTTRMHRGCLYRNGRTVPARSPAQKFGHYR